MTPNIEHLELRNAIYIAENGQQQKMSRMIIRKAGEIARTSPEFLLSASPTIDHSHFLCYLSEALKLCPVEAAKGFADILSLCLKIDPKSLPHLSAAIEGLHKELCVMDKDFGDEAINKLFDYLSDKQMTTLVSKGAKSESSRQKKLGEVLISQDFSDVLEHYISSRRPDMLSKIPTVTAMAIFRRHGWKGALEKSSSKARENLFAEDLGL